MIRTIDDVAVEGRCVLVRADLNVPLDGDRITDDGRIRASLPTLATLISRGARVIVCSHLGRPGGRPDLKYSLAPVAARLGGLLGQEVDFPGDITGHQARSAIAALRPGGLVILENLRFDEAETSKDDMVRGYFADRLVAPVDLYVADGFGAMHRKHASVYDVPLRCVSAVGYLVQAEVAALRQLTADIQRPYVVVLGGAKVADKFDAFGSLISRADRILVGGAMAFPFPRCPRPQDRHLAARGGPGRRGGALPRAGGARPDRAAVRFRRGYRDRSGRAARDGGRGRHPGRSDGLGHRP
jgi:phosphoglycerate kinase